MNQGYTDDRIIAEAKAEREKELKLARIHEDGLTERRRRELSDMAARRPWKVGALALVLVAIVILGITYAILQNADHNRQQHDRDIQHQQQTAQECIRAGNIWINDDCLIARKP